MAEQRHRIVMCRLSCSAVCSSGEVVSEEVVEKCEKGGVAEWLGDGGNE